MTTKTTVGWIGLGAMGSGMAASLITQGYSVKAYDVWAPSLKVAVDKGAVAANTPREAATGIQVLALMVVNAQQVEEVLFGSGEVADALTPGSSIICFSTVPPTFLMKIRERLDALGKNIGLCDSPVSGGFIRAAEGQLSVMTSGTDEAISTARPVFEALTRAPNGKLTVVGNTVGVASNFKLINQVFAAVHIAATGEAMALASNMGLNPRMLYNLVKAASGNSFMFTNRVPWQLQDDGIPKSAMTIITKDIGIVMDEARLENFSAPLCSLTEQIFIASLGAGLSKEDDGNIIKLWERFGVKSVKESGTVEEAEEAAKELTITAKESTGKVLFIGLGAMGAGMAMSIQKAGIEIVGHDSYSACAEKYVKLGGKVVEDPVAAAKETSVVVLMPVTAVQAEEILFGKDGKSGIAKSLPKASTVILTSTVPPSAAARIQSLLDQQGAGHQLVDAPVAGGPVRADIGDLTILASGETAALEKACKVLQAMSTSTGNTKNLHFIPGGVGTGSKVKAVNQLLAGIHIAVAAEAYAFAKKKNMDLEKIFDVVSVAAGGSYCMVDRVPRMFTGSPEVHSALDTFVKDLGIVLAEAKKTYTPVFLASVAHQQFTMASASGLGKVDDSSIVRLWEKAGIDVRLSK